jgi:hypothetical protein
MSSQEMESYFGTLFSPSKESTSSPSESSGPDTSLSAYATSGKGSLTVSPSDESSLLSTLLDFLRRKGLYVLGAIVVLLLIIWLYRRYQHRQRPEYFEPHEDSFEDDEILTEDMIIDSERAGAPSQPSFSYKPDPQMGDVHVPSPPQMNTENPLLKLEQKLTQLYSTFETSANEPNKDIQGLHTLLSGMASILAKMKEHILPVLQSEQAPAELKQQLQKGLQDAELIVTMAQNKIEEVKRIQTATENDEEKKSVVKNMHYLGLGNKIKRAKGNFPGL